MAYFRIYVHYYLLFSLSSHYIISFALVTFDVAYLSLRVGQPAHHLEHLDTKLTLFIQETD